MEKKNWIVRYYDEKGNKINSHIIKDRTEHEAEKEAIADMPKNCDDWSLSRMVITSYNIDKRHLLHVFIDDDERYVVGEVMSEEEAERIIDELEYDLSMC